jgi:hypothetical protein
MTKHTLRGPPLRHSNVPRCSRLSLRHGQRNKSPLRVFPKPPGRFEALIRMIIHCLKDGYDPQSD